ncbi:MAG: hypothetical protein Q8755_02765 [Candidatus Phytoplasma australasiaticum]|nr:hypothetical protein [Candidatus Phytoplasma australasiaticum]
MHQFDFNMLMCLYFAQPRLPEELLKIVFAKTADYRKRWHKVEQNPNYCGQSKSAAKRRAKRYEKCVKCGNWIHEGKCSENQTHSQFEYTMLIREGAIRYRAEHPIRKGSNIDYAVQKEINMLKEKPYLNVKLLSKIAAEQVQMRYAAYPSRVYNRP